jgi:hypothetical protein
MLSAMGSHLPDGYTDTRRALHAVAEQVLAAALHQATGRIGLRVTPTGFSTPVFEVGGAGGSGGSVGVVRQIRVEGSGLVDLVVSDDGRERRAPLRTLREAAALVGVEPGAPADVYPPATSLDPDAPLDLHPAAVELVHRWFHVTATALDRLSERHRDLDPSVAQLWPEHFDVAATMAEANYGGSPGDDEHDSPYAYVGPWDVAQLDRQGDGGELWNEPFGASRDHTALPTADAMLGFFDAGLSVLDPRNRPPEMGA